LKDRDQNESLISPDPEALKISLLDQEISKNIPATSLEWNLEYPSKKSLMVQMDSLYDAPHWIFDLISLVTEIVFHINILIFLEKSIWNCQWLNRFLMRVRNNHPPNEFKENFEENYPKTKCV